MKLFFKYLLCIAFLSCFSKAVVSQEKRSPIIVKIILGSTREGRFSEILARELQRLADIKFGFILELVDLRDYALPFLKEEVPPIARTEINDPAMQIWSNAIKEADAYIILVPEYNAGYPGVLKNALDSLYSEWNDKPVGFIGYSGGPSGGASAIKQLQQVTQALKMIPIATTILIPQSYILRSEKGIIINNEMKESFFKMLDDIGALL